MVKAGILGAGFGFVYVMSLALLSPLCAFCFTPLLGLGVGYLTGHFDEPTKREGSLSRGSIAGSIAGLGVVVGQILAAIVNGVLITNLEDLPAMVEQFGLPQGLFVVEPTQYWQSTLLLGSFCSGFNLLLIVGLATYGSLLWFRRNRGQVEIEV